MLAPWLLGLALTIATGAIGALLVTVIALYGLLAWAVKHWSM